MFSIRVEAVFVLVSKLFFCYNNLFYMPVSLPFHFLPIFGCVAQTDGSNIANILWRKLKSVNISPEKKMFTIKLI